MKRKIYLHYGGDFNIERFEKVRNRPFTNKPFGGFWASAEDAKYGWKQWCRQNEFDMHRLKYVSRFKINTDKVLIIDTVEKAFALPERQEYPEEHCIRISYPILPDFEKLMEEYDVIDFRISKDKRLYRALYGWDCDSILVMNPDVIRKEA